MIRLSLKLTFILLFLIGITTITFPQGQTGSIVGKVTDSEGLPLPGVTVTARSSHLQGIRSIVTNQNGNFKFPLLPIGDYSLTFELSGFEKLTQSGYEIRLGFILTINVTLKIATISEEVIVTAETQLIDKTNTDNSYRLKAEDLARVPAQGRTIQEITTYTPGVTGVRMDTKLGTGTGLPSFRGQGEEGNNWVVDGLSLKSAQKNSPSVQVNLDAWEEVQIITDGFSPDLGQAQGGIVNIVTKSGGNKIHGEVGVFLRDSNLRAERKSQLSVVSVPNTSIHQYIGNLGGPILKDKLWFFISNNFNRTWDKADESSIGWLTIPSWQKRLNTNNIFGKVTFTPHMNHTISLNGILDSFVGQSGGIGLPEIYTKDDYKNYMFRLNYRAIIMPNLLLTAALGKNEAESSASPLDDNLGPARYFWTDLVQYTNNSEGIFAVKDRRTDFTVGLTQFLELKNWGNHEFGGGFFYYKNDYTSRKRWTGRDLDPWIGNGFDNGILLTWKAPGIPLTMSEYAESDTNNSTRGYGFYIQDSFTLDRFTLMVGLRAETQKVYDDLGNKLWEWSLGDFFSPRIALAIDLFNDGKNVLKFSFGQFAQPVTTYTLSFFNNKLGTSVRFYDWIGGSNPSDAQLKDNSNWTFTYEQSATATQYNIDLDLKPNKTNKFLVEFDRQIGKNWALKLRGIYSYSRNLLDTVAIYDPETLFKYIFTNFELKKRDYKALEIEVNGRIAGRFMLNAAYTWSQDKGTNPGQRETYQWGGSWGGPYDITVFGWHPALPDGHPAKDFIDTLFDGLGGRGIGDEGWYGYLPYGVDHQIKILGTYFAPYGFNISAGMEFLSGYHWEKKGLTASGFYLKYLEGRGGRTTPSHLYLDVLIEKDFILPKGYRIGVGLNIFNLLNSQRPVSYINEDTDLFGEVWGRQLPRWLQLKLSFRF